MRAIFFKEQLKSNLLEKYEILCLDLPGHGKSESLKSYSITEILNILLFNLEGIDNIILIGHSLGGHLSIQLTRALKSRCKGLILMGCPPLRTPLNIEQAYVLNEGSANFLQKDLSEISISKIAKLIYPYNNKVHENIRDSIKNTDGKFREGFAASLVEEQFYDEVKALNLFKGKILFVLGENDLLVNKNYIEDINSELHHSSLHIIENAGHCLHIESPNQLNRLIAEFGQSIDLGNDENRY